MKKLIFLLLLFVSINSYGQLIRQTQTEVLDTLITQIIDANWQTFISNNTAVLINTGKDTTGIYHSNRAILDATTASFTTTISSAISANTGKDTTGIYHSNRTALNSVSGTNTGDQDLSTFLLKANFGDSLQAHFLIDLDSAGFIIDTTQVKDLLLFVQNNGGTASMVYPGAGVAVSTSTAWGTSLTNTTVGSNLLELPNPDANTFLKLNSNNTVSALDFRDFQAAIGIQAHGRSIVGQIPAAGITFLKMNNNVASWRSAALFLSDIGAGDVSFTDTVSIIATKYDIDTISAAELTLQEVTDFGATSTNDVTVNSIDIAKDQYYKINAIPAFTINEGTATGTYPNTYGGQGAGNDAANSQTSYGQNAGNNATGKRNTLGGSATGINSTGDDSDFWAYQAGRNNTGHKVSARGTMAGKDNTGDNSVFDGYGAGEGNTLDNQYILKHSAANANPLITGDFLSRNLWFGNSIYIAEQATPDADSTGQFQLWVKNTTPNELWGTDDAGSDFQLGTASATNLSLGTVTATTMDVNSSAGTNATLIAADTDDAGLLTAAGFDAIAANTGKDTTGIYHSNRAILDATTASFTTTLSSEISANTSKTTNATHTGQVTGATVLTLDKTAITDQTLATATSADTVLIIDATDGLTKKAAIADFASAGGDMSAAVYDPATITEQLIGLTAIQTLTNKTLTTPTIGDFTNATHAHTANASGGTLAAAAISDFDTEVGNNTAVAANTGKDTTGIYHSNRSILDATTASFTTTISSAISANTGKDTTGIYHSNRSILDATTASFTTTLSSEISANTSKTTNATHTGEVTGSGSLTLDESAIENQPLVTIVGLDTVLIRDATDGNFKKGLVSDIVAIGTSPTFADISGYSTTEADYTIQMESDVDMFIKGAGPVTNWKFEESTATLFGSIFSGTDFYLESSATKIEKDGSGNMLFTDAVTGAKTLAELSAAGGTPGGSNTQIQYNNGGAFGGSVNLTFDGTDVTVQGDVTVANIAYGEGWDGNNKATTQNSIFDKLEAVLLTIPPINSPFITRTLTSALTNEQALSELATGFMKSDGSTGIVTTQAQIALASDVSGNLPVANLNSGTSASGSTFWRGDGIWATPAGSGDFLADGTIPMTGNLNLAGNNLIGGTATSSDLNFKTTTGEGTSGADMHFLTGNDGATEAMTILNDGKVGINEAAPEYELEINGDLGTSGSIFKNVDNSSIITSGGTSVATGAYSILSGSTRTNQKGNIAFWVNTAEAYVGGNDHMISFGHYNGASTWSKKLIISKDGYVGVLNSTPSVEFDVTGAGLFSSTVTATNFILSSDRRLKGNIKKIKNLNWVDNVKFKSFSMKNDKTHSLRYGIIAQDIKKINPEMVTTNKDGMMAVKYIDVLIAKVARQDEIINNLIKRIEKLEDEK